MTLTENKNRHWCFDGETILDNVESYLHWCRDGSTQPIVAKEPIFVICAHSNDFNKILSQPLHVVVRPWGHVPSEAALRVILHNIRGSSPRQQRPWSSLLTHRPRTTLKTRIQACMNLRTIPIVTCCPSSAHIDPSIDILSSNPLVKPPARAPSVLHGTQFQLCQ